MKNIFILALTAAICCMPAAAQNKSENNNPTAVERFTERQSRYIISNLGLSGDTAAQFAELYAAYKEEMMGVKDCYPMHRRHHAYSDHHGNHHAADNCRPEENCAPEALPQLTDEQIEENIMNRFAQARKMLDIREKYYKAFREILTPGQIQAMYAAERQCAERFMQKAENCQPSYRHHR